MWRMWRNSLAIWGVVLRVRVGGGTAEFSGTHQVEKHDAPQCLQAATEDVQLGLVQDGTHGKHLPGSLDGARVEELHLRRHMQQLLLVRQHYKSVSPLLTRKRATVNELVLVLYRLKVTATARVPSSIHLQVPGSEPHLHHTKHSEACLLTCHPPAPQ